MGVTNWPEAFSIVGVVLINGLVLVAICAPEVFRRRGSKGGDDK
jgi:hypothetical protein